MNEGDGTDVQACLVHMGRTGAVGLQSLCDHPQKDAQHHAQHRSVALHEVTKPLGNRQHPLAHRQAGEYVIVQVRCCLHHAPGGARGADSPAFAGEGYKVVVPTVAAASAGKAMGKEQNADYVWIIDPLDGTTNFIHGFPVYCISIALAHRGIIQQAVIYDPTRNDLFYASRGRGAYLNDRRLRVSQRKHISSALISTGFPYRPGDDYKKYLQIFEDMMKVCVGLRRPGAAALDLAYVAAGYADGFFETGLKPWDIAAGSLLITEAGGLVGNFTGDAENFLEQGELLAGNPKIYGQMVALLSQYSDYQNR